MLSNSSKRRRKKKMMHRKRGQSNASTADFKSGCKKFIINFMQNSSIYILDRIVNSSRLPSKIFWIVALIVGITGFSSQVSEFLISYYEYPVVVSLDSVHAEFQQFPAVTVCNHNMIRNRFDECLDKNLKYDECMNTGYVGESESPVEDVPEAFCDIDMEDYSNYSVGNASDMIKYFDTFFALDHRSRAMYGHQSENFIVSCSFGGTKCGYDDFKLSLSYRHGNCFTYNWGEEKVLSSRIGPGSGLELELDIEIEEYSKFSPTAGARIHVHDPHTDGSPDRRGINARTGFETNIAVSRTVSTRLPPPYKDKCRRYGLGDGKDECLENCYENCTLSLCFCSESLYIREGIPACNFTDPRVECCVTICNREMGKCDCPIPCKETTFNLQISSSTWPSKAYYDAHENEFQMTNGTEGVLSYNKVRQTRLRLEVYYDSMDLTTCRHSPKYQSSELLSEIGGQMGLWLGMSLVAFFEWMEVCLRSLYNIA